MYTYTFAKYASPVGAPVWVHIPGTPLTLPGRQTQFDRLPGMTDWAPQPVISRVAQGLQKNTPLEEIAKNEGEQGIGKAVGAGLLGGGVAGTLAGRLFSGEAGTAPLKDVLKKGITAASLRGLRNIPKGMLALPLLGAGGGTALGLALWQGNKANREQQAQDVARGLLTERILQRHQLREATRDVSRSSLPSRFGPLNVSTSEYSPLQSTLNAGVQTAQEPEAYRSVLGGGSG